MIRVARLLLVAVLAASAASLPLQARAHEGAIEATAPGTPPPEIARTAVYTFRGDGLDPRRWRTIERSGADKYGPGIPELQYYSSLGVSVQKNVLHLSALRLSHLDPLDGYEYQYQSGRVESVEAFLYARFEVRLKIPIGSGLWPAVWLRTPASAGPLNGQLDIFDGFGSHTDAWTSSADVWARGRLISHTCVIVENYQATTPCRRIGNPLRKRLNLARDFHTFSLDWAPDHMTWFVDGAPYWTVTRDIPRVPMMLVMDLAVGGAQDGFPPSGTRFPADFNIMSVTVAR